MVDAVYDLYGDALDARDAQIENLREALSGMQSFVAVMFGQGPDAKIPETVNTPIGIPIKLGDLMRATSAALTPVTPSKSRERGGAK